MHSKQLKHPKPLNPNRSGEEWEGKVGLSDAARGRATGESLSQWEMTNAICPEHSACVNPRRVPADPHPSLRPLYPLTLQALPSASVLLVED